MIDALELVGVWFVILGCLFGSLIKESYRKHPPLRK